MVTQSAFGERRTRREPSWPSLPVPQSVSFGRPRSERCVRQTFSRATAAASENRGLLQPDLNKNFESQVKFSRLEGYHQVLIPSRYRSTRPFPIYSRIFMRHETATLRQPFRANSSARSFKRSRSIGDMGGGRFSLPLPYSRNPSKTDHLKC